MVENGVNQSTKDELLKPKYVPNVRNEKKNVMTDFLIYSGIAIIIVGCLVCFYGAFKYMKVKNSTMSEDIKADARLTFNRYRMAWMIMGAIGCLLVFLAAFTG